MNAPREVRGLTLVEMLVTLVLVSLVVALVTGGIGQGGAMLERVTRDQGTVYEELMARAWVRQTIGAAVAPDETRPGLRGDGGSLRLWSFRPLLASEGVATELDWNALPQGGLEYREGGQTIRIAALPPLARFEYQAADLAWHTQWPPADDTGGGLPLRVRLVFAGDDDRLDVTVLTRRTQAEDAEEAVYDSE